LMVVAPSISKQITLVLMWYNLCVDHFFSTNKNFFTIISNLKIEIL